MNTDSTLTPLEDRKFRIQLSGFVHTPVSMQLFQRMEELLQYPQQGRMPSLLLMGEANSGKSRLLETFTAAHPPHQHPENYCKQMPVVRFELGDASERGFYDDALEAMGVKACNSHKTQQRERQFLNTAADLGVKMLIIDEFHNAYLGSGREQLKFLALVRHITNLLLLPLVVAGTEEARTFLFSDPQLSTRFTHTILPLWTDGAEYRGFLLAMEKQFMLRKPSDLATSKEIAQVILQMSEGLTGEIVNLLKLAAVKAVETGTEQITMKTLESVGWTCPSERRR